MMQLIKWYNNIVDAGANPLKDHEEIKRVRLSNLISLTVFITGTPFSVLFALKATMISGIILFLYIISFTVVIKLNQLQLYKFARVLMLFLLNGAIVHYTIWFGKDSGLHRMMIPFVCVPFLVFDIKNSFWIIIGVLMSASGYLIMDFVPFEPVLKLSKDSTDIIYYSITTIFWIWLMFEMIYLSNQNHTAIRNLNRQRNRQTAVIVNTQEAERTRISRDLHDGLGQLLSATMVNLERMNQQEAELIEKTKDLVTQSVNEIKNVSFFLMPGMLEAYGLIMALEELVSRIRSMEKFDLFFHVHDFNQDLISKDAQHNIYRIVQEGLNNIVKHSDASEVSLQLMVLEGNLIVTLEDNGIGFDQAKLEQKGRGLQNMDARSEWLDGSLSVDSSPGVGTTLI